MQDEAEGNDAIINLMKEPVGNLEEVSSSEQQDKFQPIIDCPNLLLIVLKITRMEYGGYVPSEFTLDDKELLNEFKFVETLNSCDDRADFSRRFAFNLLKAKYLLDNHIVHHSNGGKELSGDNPWKLQYYCQETSKGYPKNLSTTQDVQKELVHLLSMFEVSFTQKQRKNYLFYCLVYLFDNKDTSEERYLKFLQNLADKYFYGVYMNPDWLNERNQPKPNAFDSIMLMDGKLNVSVNVSEGIDYARMFEEIYKHGRSDIPLFVFNYTDYRIWKMYADELRSKNTKKGSEERNNFFMVLGCSDFELDPFNNFYFSRTRKSLEHFCPQAKAGDGKPLSHDDINCFGNFAMIGAEANSSGSNWDPIAKLDHYGDGKSDPVSVASLKFKIMMQTCQDNHKDILNGNLQRPSGLEWNAEDIQRISERCWIYPFVKSDRHE